MDQHTQIVGIGQSYSDGDVFQVVGTNEFLQSVGLISEYPEGQGSVVRILAFSVNGNMNTLTPANIMNPEQLPISYQSGVTIENANVVLNRTSIMGHQEIDPLQRVAMGQEFTEVLAGLHELESAGLSKEDLAFISDHLDTLDLENGPDEFWNQLREYYYNDNYTNPDIKQAYKEADRIHTKYLTYASLADTLPVTIKNSNVLAGNSSLQKHDSGNFIVDNSNIILYGYPDPIMPNDVGGSISLLNHSGATGDIIIQNDSELSLYAHSNLRRAGDSGNIYIIGSTINMMGEDTTYTEDVEDASPSISVSNGNVQLTNGSILNVYGMGNDLGLPESEFDFATTNWQE